MKSDMDSDRNIVLIGMPGAGKSTVGIILAKRLSFDFADTDVLIQAMDGRSLQEIVDADGHRILREIEEKAILNLRMKKTVIATGGSAVYSEKAMRHLKANGTVVFLEVTEKTILSRINDFATRGLAKGPNQTFSELFAERLPLYRKHADITLACDGLTQDDVCHQIQKRRIASF